MTKVKYIFETVDFESSHSSVYNIDYSSDQNASAFIEDVSSEWVDNVVITSKFLWTMLDAETLSILMNLKEIEREIFAKRAWREDEEAEVIERKLKVMWYYNIAQELHLSLYDSIKERKLK